tara:strand:+ start:437 stop:643 length:207 start_codon:yes stop_codon:yes gene_type:complete
MKDLVKNLIYELELKKELEKRNKSNYIDFNNYFKYSGEKEKYTKDYARRIKNTKKLIKWLEKYGAKKK